MKIIFIGVRGEALEVLVDDEDYERLNIFAWQKPAHSVQREIEIDKREFRDKRQFTSMAQEIFKTHLLYDHRDRNPLNNQKSNLRLCSRAQNSINADKLEGCTSMYKGVCRVRNSWVAYITVRRKRFHLGTFIEELEAAKAYDNAATKHYGEFALLNLP